MSFVGSTLVADKRGSVLAAAWRIQILGCRLIMSESLLPIGRKMSTASSTQNTRKSKLSRLRFRLFTFHTIFPTKLLYSLTFDTLTPSLNCNEMKLPMMLRTTTQHGMQQSASVRSIPARCMSVAAASRTVCSLSPRNQSSSVISLYARTRATPTRTFSTSRHVAQPTAKYTASPLTDGEYHKLSNHVLDSLTETFEILLEEADVETLEEQARAQNKGATRGPPASEWDIECAVSTCFLRITFASSIGISDTITPPSLLCNILTPHIFPRLGTAEHLFSDHSLA